MFIKQAFLKIYQSFGMLNPSKACTEEIMCFYAINKLNGDDVFSFFEQVLDLPGPKMDLNFYFHQKTMLCNLIERHVKKQEESILKTIRLLLKNGADMYKLNAQHPVGPMTCIFRIRDKDTSFVLDKPMCDLLICLIWYGMRIKDYVLRVENTINVNGKVQTTIGKTLFRYFIERMYWMHNFFYNPYEDKFVKDNYNKHLNGRHSWNCFACENYENPFITSHVLDLFHMMVFDKKCYTYYKSCVSLKVKLLILKGHAQQNWNMTKKYHYKEKYKHLSYLSMLPMDIIKIIFSYLEEYNNDFYFKFG